jgi:hypothetical protein
MISQRMNFGKKDITKETTEYTPEEKSGTLMETANHLPGDWVMKNKTGMTLDYGYGKTPESDRTGIMVSNV